MVAQEVEVGVSFAFLLWTKAETYFPSTVQPVRDLLLSARHLLNALILFTSSAAGGPGHPTLTWFSLTTSLIPPVISPRSSCLALLFRPLNHADGPSKAIKPTFSLPLVDSNIFMRFRISGSRFMGEASFFSLVPKRYNSTFSGGYLIGSCWAFDSGSVVVSCLWLAG